MSWPLSNVSHEAKFQELQQTAECNHSSEWKEGNIRGMKFDDLETNGENI
jgi:hypothetical protein